MNFAIFDPFELELEVIELDEKIPSFRANVRLTIKQFENLIRYEGATWFEWRVWNEFESNLRGNGIQGGVLMDINENFTFAMKPLPTGASVDLRIKKVSVGSNLSTTLAVSAMVNHDIAASLTSSFIEFGTFTL